MNRLLKSLVFVLLMESVGFSHAQPINASQDTAPKTAASSPVQTPDRKPPDPAVFWSKVMRLLTEAKGNLTHERVETVLGVKTYLDSGSEGYGYSVLPSDFYGIYLNIQEKDSNTKNRNGIYFVDYKYSLYIKWSEDVFGDWKKGECLQEKQVAESFFEAGWNGSRNMGDGRFGGQQDVFWFEKKGVRVSHFDYYKEGRRRYITAGSESACVIGVYMTESP